MLNLTLSNVYLRYTAYRSDYESIQSTLLAQTLLVVVNGVLILFD